jgi:hypothetical protein
LVGASGTIGYMAPGKLYYVVWLLHWEDYKIISHYFLISFSIFLCTLLCASISQSTGWDARSQQVVMFMVLGCSY